MPSPSAQKGVKLSLMKDATRIKPVGYFKAHAAEVFKELAEHRKPIVITQNGEAKAVIQDVQTFDETQESLALLKILALGNRQIEEGKVHSFQDIAMRLRKKRTV